MLPEFGRQQLPLSFRACGCCKNTIVVLAVTFVLAIAEHCYCCHCCVANAANAANTVTVMMPLRC